MKQTCMKQTGDTRARQWFAACRSPLLAHACAMLMDASLIEMTVT
ncbi:hypothetical protein LMG24235_06530 [Paraburkholderia sabiae]|jgi:hypothetical protein|nr:hypothetical protein LMG24235_06530 [Paraburkholderia sabiae]